jgi:membrane protease YdiL (CAAX protease family)
LRRLFTFDLKFDRDVVVMTVASTLLMLADRYHNFTGLKSLDRVLIYLFVPMLITAAVFRRPLREFGFQLGDWKAGLFYAALGVAIGTPIIWWSAQNPVMHEYYKPLLTPVLPLITFMELIGWEFIFRGWLLFGYKKDFGAHALWLQAVPFALMHLGKPELETVSTIFGGFVFGLIAWKTRSFLYPFLIHWYIFTLVVVLAGR